MELIIKIQIDGEKATVKNVKIEKEAEVICQDAELKNCEISKYARFFDEACVGWTKDSEYNLCLLKQKQDYCNDLLRGRGHLFLNEVYDILGMPRTKAGAIVGWVYDEEHPYGDNFVDFDLYSERNKNFINGYENIALLDFNVDGNILNLI